MNLNILVYVKKKCINRNSAIFLEKYFSRIHKNNLFTGTESKSGAGSDFQQTEVVRKMIPMILKEFKIESICDLPCGDFNWMRLVDLNSIPYTGYDIQPELILELNTKYSTSTYKFHRLDVVTEVPQKHDLVICRDLLVHLSYDDAKKALLNIKKSGSKFLLTTTFPNHKQNMNVIYTQKAVGWYPINLEMHPFNLDVPLRLYNENCTEGAGEYADKSLVLYQIN